MLLTIFAHKKVQLLNMESKAFLPPRCRTIASLATARFYRVGMQRKTVLVVS